MHSPRSKIGAYVALTKPRIIELLLVTTVPTMILADKGLPSIGLILATLVGGTLAAGGANAINMFVDRDIDRLMPRTQHRPLVTGAVTPGAALVFAIALEVAAFAELWFLVNLLSAVLALAATLFYVFVYTLWLKRTSTQNIVIGGAAGAVPVLVGWAAVDRQPRRGRRSCCSSSSSCGRRPTSGRWRSATPTTTAPRTCRCCRPSSRSTSRAAGCSATRSPCGRRPWCWPRSPTSGWIYAAAAFVLGAVFVSTILGLRRYPSPRRAMRVFQFSITYVTLLFAALAVDTLVRYGL